MSKATMTTQRNGSSRNSLPTGWEMEQLFDRLFTPLTNGNGHASWCPAASVWETGEGYFIEIEIPGVAKDDLELTFQDAHLEIKARRPQPEGGRTYLHNERRFGQGRRLVPMPEAVDPDSIEAELCDGLLTIKLAKRPETQPKKIAVKVG